MNYILLLLFFALAITVDSLAVAPLLDFIDKIDDFLRSQD